MEYRANSKAPKADTKQQAFINRNKLLRVADTVRNRHMRLYNKREESPDQVSEARELPKLNNPNKSEVNLLELVAHRQPAAGSKHR